MLEASTSPYAGRNFKVFLQGSYGNDTNIFSESDVDIVVQLDDCFFSDLKLLSEDEKAVYKTSFSDASYTLSDFKRDILSVLVAQYGSAVKVGGKAITIEASNSRRKADVIVATQFRRYLSFRTVSESAFVEGICFINGNGERIANYPRLHSKNLTMKHQASSKWLKPLVRIFKNMRSRMIDAALLKPGVAPSYYIEGLLYNVPNELLFSSYQTCVANILDWYLNDAIKVDLLCANEQYYLLRDHSHICWPQVDCDAFIEAAVKLWNEW